MTKGRSRRTTFGFAVASAALAFAFLLSLSIGAVNIPVADIVTWVTGGLSEDDLGSRVLSGVRFPRSLGAVVVGAVLGSTGAALQGINRTRVVDAHLIGISAAGGLGVALGAVALPSGNLPPAIVVTGALFGGLYALTTRMLGRVGGGTTLVVLMGIAAGFTITAWTGVLVLGVDNPAVPTLSFFIFGSLVGAQTSVVVPAAVVSIIALGILWRIGPGLDLLALGDRTAKHVGFDTKSMIPISLVMVGVAVGSSVAIGGVIGFVGLIVPTVVRPIFGASQRVLIPAAAIVGAALVLVVDTAARTLLSPIEIPIGLIMTGLGGPILIWLLRREVLR
ncbi:MAG: iron ABC transporter permease [Actinomycetota bacterium]